MLGEIDFNVDAAHEHGRRLSIEDARYAFIDEYIDEHIKKSRFVLEKTHSWVCSWYEAEADIVPAFDTCSDDMNTALEDCVRRVNNFLEDKADEEISRLSNGDV